MLCPYSAGLLTLLLLLAGQSGKCGSTRRVAWHVTSAICCLFFAGSGDWGGQRAERLWAEGPPEERGPDAQAEHH